MKMGWKLSLLIYFMTIYLIIPNVKPILTTTEDGKLHKKLPAISLQKDMNNDRCDPVICEKTCTGYCMREQTCTKVAEEDLEMDEISLKSAVRMNSSYNLQQRESVPYYSHTECLCARNAKRVKYSVCYTHNNQPLEPAQGGDYSQVKAFEECQLHCSMRVQSSYTSRSDDREGEDKVSEVPKIYAALCDTNCNGRLQRFCYCVNFDYQPFPQPGEGWGEDGGWSSTSAGGHGWNTPPTGDHGWNIPPNNGWNNSPSIGWTPPVAGTGWNSIPSEHAHPPPVPNGWNSLPTEHGHPPSVPSGWTPPLTEHGHPPSIPSGWIPPSTEHGHPPSVPSGWIPPSTEHGHPPSAPSGWNSPPTSDHGPPPSVTNGWTPPSVTNGWTPPSVTNGWTPPSVTNGWTPPSVQLAGSGWNSGAPAGSGWIPPLIGVGWPPNVNAHKSPGGVSEKVEAIEEDKKDVPAPDKTEVIPSKLTANNTSINKVPLNHLLHMKPSKTPEKGSDKSPTKHLTAAKPAIGKLPPSTK